MAVYRPTPKCPHCGRDIAKAIYVDNPGFIGDTFSHWENIQHDCQSITNIMYQVDNDAFFENYGHLSKINPFEFARRVAIEFGNKLLKEAADNAKTMNDPDSYTGNTGSEFEPDIIVNKESITSVIKKYE